EGLVRGRPVVRRRVTFRRHNLRDGSLPLRRSCDAMFFRHVLFYFDRALQHEVIERLVGFLALGGDLFLGHSESLLGMSTGLRLAGKTVYHKVRGGPPR